MYRKASSAPFNAYIDAEYVAQNYIDGAAAQPFSQSSANTDFLNPPASADLSLSMPNAQQADSTLQPLINAPIMDVTFQRLMIIQRYRVAGAHLDWD